MTTVVSNETACNDIQDVKPRRYLATNFNTLQGDCDLDYSDFFYIAAGGK